MSTIVIVDDQFTSRRILEAMIGAVDSEANVVAFDDPLEALAFARGNNVDLLISDYRMPGLDGVELLTRFRKIPDKTDVPVIIITVLEDTEIRYSALTAGATDFLTKPIDYVECIARCRNLLDLRHQHLIIKKRAVDLEKQLAQTREQLAQATHQGQTKH